MTPQNNQSEVCKCGYAKNMHPIFISGVKVQEKGEVFLNWLCEKFTPIQSQQTIQPVKQERKDELISNSTIAYEESDELKTADTTKIQEEIIELKMRNDKFRDGFEAGKSQTLKEVKEMIGDLPIYKRTLELKSSFEFKQELLQKIEEKSGEEK